MKKADREARAHAASLAETLTEQRGADQGDRASRAPDRQAVQPVAADPVADRRARGPAAVPRRTGSDEFPSVAVTRQSVRELLYRRHDRGARARLRRAHLRGRDRRQAGQLEQRQGHRQAVPARQQRSARAGSRRTYEDDLRGARRASRASRSTPRARPIRDGRATQPPQPGNDLQLTIDLDVQKIDRERAGASSSTRSRGGKEDGTRHINEGAGRLGGHPRPDTTATSSPWRRIPTYDPVSSSTASRATGTTSCKGDPRSRQPVDQPGFQGQYAPGSTFKPVTALAAMQSGLITANTYYNDTGLVCSCTDKRDVQQRRRRAQRAA